MDTHSSKHKANKNKAPLSPKKLSDSELSYGKYYWYNNYNYKDVDEAIKPFLAKELRPFRPGELSWLRQARMALFYSVNYVARQLNKPQQVYCSYELSEEKGTISLNTLARAADAMDCELVYALRPKSRQTFSDIIWNKILPKALRSNRLNLCHQKRLGAALAATAISLMDNPKFRNEHNWSKRLNKKSSHFDNE